MRQGERAFQNLAGIIQQIQVQGARRVGDGTSAPEVRFDFMQKCHESKGLKTGLDRRDRVGEGRVMGIGPGLAFIEGRNSSDFDAGSGQRRQRRSQGLGGRPGLGWNIGA